MSSVCTTVRGYDFTKRALEAWVSWRFAGHEVVVKVRRFGARRHARTDQQRHPLTILPSKDGDFNVFAPAELTSVSHLILTTRSTVYLI